MDAQFLVIICAVGAVSLIAYFVMRLLIGNGDNKLRDRLAGRARTDALAAPGRAGGKKLNLREFIQQVGQAAAQPFMPKSREAQSGMRENLNKAGIYAANALKVLVGCKVIFLFTGLFLGYFLTIAMDAEGAKFWCCFSMGGVVGYLTPQFWLRMRIKANQQALTYGLADGLDLMVVCVEAGLTVDAAMQRVGQELGLAHPALAREFGIAHMETRVGLSRTEALRNLGSRTGNSAIQSLVTMLVQADRFGTSIAQALRVHAETLRLNRQYAAEEMASKASVKISFPLVLFIFPSTFIVLVGPTILDLMNSPLF